MLTEELAASKDELVKLLSKEIEARVPYWDGYSLEHVTLRSPEIKLTGRTGRRGMRLMLEVIFYDIEPTEYLSEGKKREVKLFIPYDEILIIN